ncbi:MAG: hypothetical protein HXY22_04930 [Alphaproteobacteria bacterium]|nr:hypothetical protein [Alphaproteobacteria bacterium]
MRLVWAILLGGLAAGVLDILYAFAAYGPLSYGLSPQQVLHSVAAGWIGREAARAGGIDTAMLGLATHFLIATIFAAIYVLAATRLPALTRGALLWGFLNGLILYGAMNYVVVPLSAAAAGHFATGSEIVPRLQVSLSQVRGGSDDFPWLLWGTIFTHTVFVGMPIALITRRFLGRQS